MLLKILGFLTALLKAIPEIKEAYKKWRYERYQKKLADALKNVEAAKTKEELKDAIINASKKFNDR
jgi:hypothetical protein